MKPAFISVFLIALTLASTAPLAPLFAANDEAESRSGQATVIDVLGNDGLAEGAQIIKVEGADNGSVEMTADKTRVIYTPESGFEGEDQFAYSVQIDGSDPQTNIVTVTVTDQTAGDVVAKEEQLAKIGSILLLLLVLAILLESGLSVVFNWRPFVVYGESRGLKTPIAIVTASIFVFSYDLNAVEDVLETFVSKDLKDTWPGQLITAFIVAGGSGLIFQMFEKFGLRNPLTRRRAAEQARQQSRLKVQVERKDVPTTQTILIKVDQAIIGSIGPDKTEFGGLLGHLVEPGIRKVELSGVNATGNPVTLEKTETIAPGATVTLPFTI